MADVLSLFGLTPEGLDQQRYQQDLKRGYELAQLDPGAAARATLQSGVGQLGRGIAGMMGIEDPQMKLISARQSVIGQLDQTDPASLLKGAQILTQMGDQQGAFALADYARKAQESLAQTKQRQAAALASEAQAGRERQQATPNDIQIANRIASLKDGITQLEAAEQTPENTRTKNILTYQLSELERITAKPEKQIAPNIKTVGVADGPSKKAVLLDVNADQLFTYEIGPDGKQIRKPYFGNVNRVTSTTEVGVKLPESQKAEQGERGKALTKDFFENVSPTARNAQKNLPAITSNLNILDKGFETGFGTETAASAAKVLAALGVQGAEKFASDSQIFLANANQAVLSKQLEQKGTQTKTDAERIEQTGARLGNTKEANKFILTVAKEQLQRDIEQRDFYAKWYRKNTTYDGAEDAWFDGEGSKSLFERPALKQYGVSASAQIPTQSKAPVNIPQAAIDALNRGVGTDAQFDAQFGAGSAKRVKGGR
jgi:hypothetical protein